MKRIILTLAALAVMVPMGAKADLIGDTVGIRYVGLGDTGVLNYVVGPGEEGDFFGNQFFDFDAWSFEIRSIANYCGIFTCNNADTVSLELSSLDFASALTGVSFDTNLTGVALAFGSDFVTFTWNEQSITTGTYLTATFSSVPEPATLALLGLGLVGIGFSRIKKAKA